MRSSAFAKVLTNSGALNGRGLSLVTATVPRPDIAFTLSSVNTAASSSLKMGSILCTVPCFLHKLASLRKLSIETSIGTPVATVAAARLPPLAPANLDSEVSSPRIISASATPQCQGVSQPHPEKEKEIPPVVCGGTFASFLLPFDATLVKC
eukprot:CAMPEP_0114114610 /NCGR_PEP_ID=MMETSP0043_2-20121206/3524_1 /TAXON_ID=464988 /ORGANISM="Hemiselmis andersenii, Strain CCMP644" /LENGTH=151 /DNA_ID=CAMNT_0001206811 /DNA_START=372 /DNA_END=824 /DNA_ORIENTATION=+